MRVTDLEKFSLEQIWRPYRRDKGFMAHLEKAPHSLIETATLLARDQSGWADLVFDRLSLIGVSFPSYIVHPLVDLVRFELGSRRPSTKGD